MADRMVCATDGNVSPFSTFQQDACLVLLGDPGAGKSYLFEAAARLEAARFLQVREFLALNPATIEPGSTLFIDALDEYRAHYGSVPAVDSLVRHIGLITSCRVRISCRSADWLGSNDLKRLSSCFPDQDVNVLRLQPLNDSEQRQLILACSTQVPQDFLAQAHRRGLGEMLGNPLTLLMLAQVVAEDQWPETRMALFEHSSIVLLEEYNDVHLLGKRPETELSGEEMLRAAGALCAVRLLADVDGFSAQERRDNRRPFINKLQLCGIASLRAALGSRVFTSANEPDTFDHGHKAIAEYLAARYLATLFTEGLPLARVRLLLGVEGKPASYLRGVHAWLPIFLTGHVNEFIEADPYGVLSYGDAASLGSQGKRILFEALIRLADADPGFRGDDRSTHALVGLAEPHLAACFESILNDPSKAYGLRTLVLDTLLVGNVIPALRTPLYNLIISRSANLSERAYAVEVLMKMELSGLESIRAAYQVLATERRGRRLRAQMLRRCLGEEVTYSDLLALYQHSVEQAQATNPPLSHWQLHDLVSSDDIPDCLDGLVDLQCSSVDEAVAAQIISFMLPLLIRYLGAAQPLNEPKLLEWLGLLNALSIDYPPVILDKLREALILREESTVEDQGLRLRVANHKGLESFPFVVFSPMPVSVDEVELSETEHHSVSPLVEEITKLEQALEKGFPPELCPPFLLGEVIFKLMGTGELAKRPWFVAYQRDESCDYIGCLARHLVNDVCIDSLESAQLLEQTTDIPLADKIEVVQRLIDFAPHLDKTAFYRIVRPYYRHLTFAQCGEQLLTLIREHDGGGHKTFILTLGLLMSLEAFSPVLEALDDEAKNEVIWQLRDLTGLVRGIEGPLDMSAAQAFYFCHLIADHYPIPVDSDGFTRLNTQAEDAEEFTVGLIGYLTFKHCRRVGEYLLTLRDHPNLASYRDHFKHAVSVHAARQRDSLHIRLGWKEVVEVLRNGIPNNVAQMQALVMDELAGLEAMLGSNLDAYKFFWNEDDGRLVTPKWEESCRDVLLSLLRPRLEARNITAEPEGHMADDKRVDIAVQRGSIKLVIELKRCEHAKVWSSVQEQLIALYTGDPGAKGYGIYGVFWHGRGKVAAGPHGVVPQSAPQMQAQLEATLDERYRSCIKFFVLDVSGVGGRHLGS
ncbi:NACHT domain-containing protein [Pseudomonas fildesensis]|uniref:NACHT domain-containing protein n=1 Tax=Pseudomonas fildesensis TaxID=1674920 RepID=UPI00387B6825